MKIAILGAGPVGVALANGWGSRHRVSVGRRRSDERPQGLHDTVTVTDVAAALARPADVVVVATPAAAVADLLRTHGAAMAGRVVIDATNALTGPPFDPANSRGRLHQLALYRRLTSQVRVHRAFCSVGWEVLEAPNVGGDVADVFHTGPASDVAVVAELITNLGMRPVWLGDGDDAADVLDGLARVWFQLALVHGHGRHLAFRLLTGSGAL